MIYLLEGIFIIPSALLLLISLSVLKDKKTKTALMVFLLSVCSFFYLFGYIFELNSPVLGNKVFWNAFEYIWIPFIPVLWVLYFLLFCNKYNRLTLPTIVLLFAVPVITPLFRLTNPFHNLFFSDFDMQGRALKYQNRIFNYLFFVYSLVCIIYSLYYLLKKLKSKESKTKNRSAMMIAVLSLPSAGMIFGLFGFSPGGFRLCPVCISLSCIIFLITYKKYGLLEEKGLLINDLQSNENLLKTLLQSVDNNLFILDVKYGKIRNVNDAFGNIFGEKLDTDMQKAKNQLMQRVYPADKGKLLSKLSSITSFEGTSPFEYRVCDKNNNYIWVSSTVKPVKNKNGEVEQVIITFNNIDEEKKKIEVLSKKAEFDIATGIYNKATAQEKIQDYLVSKQGCKGEHALLLCDIDNLKTINDVNGHRIGDKIISDVAKILRHDIDNSSIVGRLGGDEFVVFIKSYSPNIDIREKITYAIAKINSLQQKHKINTRVSVSIGIAVAPYDGISFDELYNNADIALYEIKNTDKNNYCFYDKSLENKKKLSPYERELLSSIKDLTIMFDTTEDGKLLISVEPDGQLKCQKINSICEKLLGVSKSDVEGHYLSDLAVEQIDLYISNFENCLKTLDRVTFFDKMAVNGKERIIRNRLAPVIKKGAVAFVVMTSKDTTLKTFRERENEELAYEYTNLFERTNVGLAVISLSNGNYNIKRANQNFLDFLKNVNKDFGEFNFEGSNLKEIYPKDFFEYENAHFDETLKKRQTVRYDWKFENIDDNFLISYSPFIADNDAFNNKKVSDVVLFERVERGICMQQVDELTNSYDKSFLREKLNVCITNKENSKRLYLCAVDIDRLSLINETFGIEAGDTALIFVADKLREVFPDDLLGRWESDKFIVIAKNTDETELATKLTQLKALEIQFNPRPFKISLSSSYILLDKSFSNSNAAINELTRLLSTKKYLCAETIDNEYINSLLKMLFKKNYESESHIQQLVRYSHAFAKHLSFDEHQKNALENAAYLHDIGKLGVSQEILTKPGKLTDEEYEEIKTHPSIGFRIAEATRLPDETAHAILHHHERYDGTGYPFGLKGEEIPFLSRIISIIDSYDVMVSGRVYCMPKKEWSAINELKRCSGTQFDPYLVAQFVDILQEGELPPFQQNMVYHFGSFE